jgi:release factor glutamine methyltransferase
MSSGRVAVLSAYARTREALSRHSVPEPGIEAEMLVREALGLDRAQYFAELSVLVPDERTEGLEALLARRLAGEPLAYLTGRREFFGLNFAVTADVLVPRQETELLVELALEFLSRPDRSGAGASAVVADVGTGSGAIAVSLAVNRSDAMVYATDISAAALSVADSNAEAHGVGNMVKFLRCDLLEAVPGKLDLIVANLPYVPSLLLDELSNEIRREPRIALDGGPDGLDPYRRLLAQSHGRLRSKGALLVELMPDQMDQAQGLAAMAFPTAYIGFARDLSGDPRALTVYMGG